MRQAPTTQGQPAQAGPEVDTHGPRPALLLTCCVTAASSPTLSLGPALSPAQASRTGWRTPPLRSESARGCPLATHSEQDLA